MACKRPLLSCVSCVGDSLSHDGAVIFCVEFKSAFDVVEAVSAFAPVLPVVRVATKEAVGVAVLARVVAHAPRGPVVAGVLAGIIAAAKDTTTAGVVDACGNGLS